MLIAIISDTHMPRGTRRLPEGCLARLHAADLIIHAGDLVTLDVLRELQEIGPVVAVHGNIDNAGVRAALPLIARVPVGDREIGIVHDAGPAPNRLTRLRTRFPEASAVVFGHSHIALHEQAPDGFQIFNPGSPTDRRRQPQHTMGLCRVDESDASLRFELVELD